MKKIIFPGIVVGIVTLTIGMVISYLFMLSPAVSADYYNAGLMRPWADPVMWLFFLYPFIQGIALSWAWGRSKALFKGTIKQRGMRFGLAIWIIATIPGMLVSYSSFQLSLLTVLSWTVSGLISLIAAGCILAGMNK